MLSTLFSTSTQSLAGEEGIFRKRAVSMKNLSRTSYSTEKVNTLPVDGRTKYSTVSKRHMDENQRASLFAIFQTEKKRASNVPDSADDAMALLDAQIAKIRGDLDAMRVEGENMVQRVATVSAGVEAAISRQSSLEMIEECNDTTTTKTVGKGSSMSLTSCDSKRDSGFVYDPAFEMMDPHKYCLPNNVKSASLPTKKCRSTTALDFIRNDLHDSQGAHLKANSIDRISCYSDSAILSMSVYGRHHV